MEFLLDTCCTASNLNQGGCSVGGCFYNVLSAIRSGTAHFDQCHSPVGGGVVDVVGALTRRVHATMVLGISRVTLTFHISSTWELKANFCELKKLGDFCYENFLRALK